MSTTTSATTWRGLKRGLGENFSKVMSDSERLRATKETHHDSERLGATQSDSERLRATQSDSDMSAEAGSWVRIWQVTVALCA